MVCGKAAAVGRVSLVQGTLAVVNQVCSLCGEESDWSSQPLLKETAAGNILLSAGILFSGSLPSKALRMLKMIGVQVFSPQTYFRHQRMYLHQAVRAVWDRQQRQLLASADPDGMLLGGDGRCDSMGHSAKYGSYSAIDLERNKVVDVQLVQVPI